MARGPRERLQCTDCGWVGITSRGKQRRAIFATSTAAVAFLIALELFEVCALGDQLWAVALTIFLISIGLRMLVRGDRCRVCEAPLSYEKRS